MTTIYQSQKLLTTTLQVTNSLVAPSITKGEVLVNNGTNIAYTPVGSTGQLLQSDSTVANGISYVNPSGGSGGDNVKVTIATSTRMEVTSGILSYTVYNPWSDSDLLDSLSIPFNSTQLTYLQIFPNGSELWNFGSGATNMFITVGVINSTGTFVASTGTSPHITLSRNTYNGTAIVYKSDVSANAWIYNAGDNITLRYTFNGGNGSIMRIGNLLTFEGPWN